MPCLLQQNVKGKSQHGQTRADTSLNCETCRICGAADQYRLFHGDEVARDVEAALLTDAQCCKRTEDLPCRRHRGANPRPSDYRSATLPLSYEGKANVTTDDAGNLLNRYTANIGQRPVLDADLLRRSRLVLRRSGAREVLGSNSRRTGQQNGVTDQKVIGTLVGNQRFWKPTRLGNPANPGNLSRYAVANQTQDPYPEPRAANQRTSLVISVISVADPTDYDMAAVSTPAMQRAQMLTVPPQSEGTYRCRELYRSDRCMAACIVERYSRQTPSVMVWGDIGYNMRSRLLSIEGNLNSNRYIKQVLELGILPLLAVLGRLWFLDNGSRRNGMRATSPTDRPTPVTVLQCRANTGLGCTVCKGATLPGIEPDTPCLLFRNVDRVCRILRKSCLSGTSPAVRRLFPLPLGDAPKKPLPRGQLIGRRAMSEGRSPSEEIVKPATMRGCQVPSPLAPRTLFISRTRMGTGKRSGACASVTYPLLWVDIGETSGRAHSPVRRDDIHTRDPARTRDRKQRRQVDGSGTTQQATHVLPLTEKHKRQLEATAALVCFARNTCPSLSSTCVSLQNVERSHKGKTRRQEELASAREVVMRVVRGQQCPGVDVTSRELDPPPPLTPPVPPPPPKNTNTSTPPLTPWGEGVGGLLGKVGWGGAVLNLARSDHVGRSAHTNDLGTNKRTSGPQDEGGPRTNTSGRRGRRAQRAGVDVRRGQLERYPGPYPPTRRRQVEWHGADTKVPIYAANCSRELQEHAGTRFADECLVTHPPAGSPSQQGELRSIPGGVTLNIFACGCRTGRCRWSAGFLGDLPYLTPLHSGAAPYSPRFTLIGSQDLDMSARQRLSRGPDPTPGEFRIVCNYCNHSQVLFVLLAEELASICAIISHVPATGLEVAAGDSHLPDLQEDCKPRHYQKQWPISLLPNVAVYNSSLLACEILSAAWTNLDLGRLSSRSKDIRLSSRNKKKKVHVREEGGRGGGVVDRWVWRLDFKSLNEDTFLSVCASSAYLQRLISLVAGGEGEEVPGLALAGECTLLRLFKLCGPLSLHIITSMSLEKPGCGCVRDTEWSESFGRLLTLGSREPKRVKRDLFECFVWHKIDVGHCEPPPVPTQGRALIVVVYLAERGITKPYEIALGGHVWNRQACCDCVTHPVELYLIWEGKVRVSSSRCSRQLTGTDVSSEKNRRRLHRLYTANDIVELQDDARRTGETTTEFIEHVDRRALQIELCGDLRVMCILVALIANDLVFHIDVP
ncbi:hypothetical protein PR048_002340 [Dryococelus australis]|uniref:Uncharacterized protein n=1 Tax=Dryococelus australis TaxID=614101 RepID=A0ABQ9ILC0_9NEOP|nr:hypothetical protein PR048_002340 [Dryococelus australis]